MPSSLNSGESSRQPGRFEAALRWIETRGFVCAFLLTVVLLVLQGRGLMAFGYVAGFEAITSLREAATALTTIAKALAKLSADTESDETSEEN